MRNLSSETVRVGLDCDGVLYGFGENFKECLLADGRDDLWAGGGDDYSDWFFYRNFSPSWTDDEFFAFCHKHADSGLLFSGALRDGATDLVDALKSRGYQIIIITDRSFGTTPNSSESNTLKCFEENDVDYDELIFSRDKTVSPTDFFLEDKLENYDALISAGTRAVLINRPWNQVSGGDSRMRVDTLQEFLDVVDASVKDGYVDLTFA